LGHLCKEARIKVISRIEKIVKARNWIEVEKKIDAIEAE